MSIYDIAFQRFLKVCSLSDKWGSLILWCSECDASPW